MADTSTVRLIVQFRKLQVVRQHPNGHNSECEHLGSGLQVAPECLVRAGQSDVWMQLSTHDKTVHAGDIGGPGAVLDERVPGGKGAIADLVDLIIPYRSYTGQD